MMPTSWEDPEIDTEVRNVVSKQWMQNVAAAEILWLQAGYLIVLHAR